MTPEQIESTLNFMLENHANAMIRMDRFDEELREQKQRMDEFVESVRAATDYNTGTYKILAEILASQSERLRWLKERGN